MLALVAIKIMCKWHVNGTSLLTNPLIEPTNNT